MPFSFILLVAVFPRKIKRKIIPKKNIASTGLAQIQAQAIMKINDMQATKKAIKTKIVAPTAPIRGIIPTNNISGYSIP